jgi:HEAT repeat protein
VTGALLLVALVLANPDPGRAGEVMARLASPSREARRLTTAEILGWPEAEALAFLRQALLQGKLLAREESARLLGELSDEEAIPILMECVAAREEVAPVRAAAARALGRLGARESVPLLVEVLPSIPVAAAEALVALDADQALPELFLALVREQARRESIRHAVAGLDPRDEARAMTSWRLESSRLATVEIGAAICRLGARQGLTGITGRAQRYFGDLPAEGLLRALSHPNPSRLLALQRIREITGWTFRHLSVPIEGEPAGWRSLVDLRPVAPAFRQNEAEGPTVILRGARTEPSRDLAARFEGWIDSLRGDALGPEEGFLVLLADVALEGVIRRWAGAPGPGPQEGAFRRIVFTRPLETALVARRLLGEGIEEEKALALMLLASFGGREELPRVRSLALGAGEAGRVQAGALDLLRILRDHASLPKILPLCRSADAEVALAAVRAAGSLADPGQAEALRTLREALGSSTSEVRLRAAEGALLLGDAGALGALHSALESTEEAERRLAGTILRVASGLDLGFHADDPAPWRAEAVSAYLRKAGIEDLEQTRERLLVEHYRSFPAEPQWGLRIEDTVRRLVVLERRAPAPDDEEVEAHRAALERSFVDLVKRSRDGSRRNPLLDLLAHRDDPDPASRLAVIRGLELGEGVEVVHPLAGFLRDSSPPVRAAAAAALGRLRQRIELEDSEAVALERRLRRVLAEELDPTVGLALEQALGR